MTDTFTDRELYLIRIFGKYTKDLFDHDDAVADTTLVERATLCAFEFVEAASFLAENELGSSLAANLCRRALLLRSSAQDLTQLLAVTKPSELEDLPKVASMNYFDELREKHGSVLREDLARKPEVGEIQAPPSEPRSEDAADNPWTVLSNLSSIVHELRTHVDCGYLNGRDATEEAEGVRQIIEREYLATIEDFQAIEIHIDDLYRCLREAKVQSVGEVRARQAIARGREIRESKS
jgi:hypothetical protein